MLGLAHPIHTETKKCDPTRCLCTPEAYMEAFLQTPDLSGPNPPGSTVIPFPICVGENLVGRVNGGNVPPNSQVIGPINNVFGARRRLIFVFNNVGLERVLALGQYRAKRILELLG